MVVEAAATHKAITGLWRGRRDEWGRLFGSRVCFAIGMKLLIIGCFATELSGNGVFHRVRRGKPVPDLRSHW
ncbi:hypothetical protein ZEAMMB73_Zm00001d041713 [Zea mays]|uniref:Uncharacterized protein n=1 Tax=Zea mays TaxID=4577 RepID=A0A1D6MXT7_MAIZE|nr:hypothetical protein ZEAMMB73_Zm00001d041713 [Zea mays]